MASKPTYEELETENLRLKQTVDELQADGEKYRAMYGHRFNCIYIHDLEGNFLDANDAALKLLGYEREEISGLNFASLIGEDQLVMAFEILGEIRQEGFERKVVEYKLRRKDGSWIWIDTGGSLIYQKGKPWAVLGVARDITARKRAETDLQKARDELENRVLSRTAELIDANRRLKQQIDERRQIETALEESEKNYRQLVQSANSIILRLDPLGNVRFINEFARKFFGYTEEEILGKHVIGTIVPPTESSGRDLAEMIADIGRHPERYVNNENENQRSNGERVWIAWTNKGIADENGVISEILCVGNDMTQRRKAEEALRESEVKFRSVTEQSANMIFINKEGRIVYCNRKCEDIMGYSREEFCSPDFDFFTLIAPESMEIVRSAFQKHMAGQEVEPYEYRLVKKDGDELDVIITTKLIDYEGGNAIIGMVTDITQRKRAERALRESEAQFRALAESAPAATLIVAEEKILYANQAFEQITGYTNEEALGMQFWDVVHPDMQELVKNRGFARQRGETVPSRYELKALTKSGLTKWMDLVATVINYGGKIATLAMAYDITERKQAGEALLAREQELESKTHDLEEMNAALKVLLQKREDDKLALEEKMLSNVQQLIEPYFDNLKQTSLSARQTNLLGIIETNLAEIISPFARDFTALKYKLTPKEIRIANLIKQAKTNKEIAEIMGLSVRTIEFHRTKIRRKFGLKDGKDNLQAHLIAHD